MKTVEIRIEIDNMQAELECVIPSDINAIIDHAKTVAVIHSRAGYLLAEAKMLYRNKKASEITGMVIKIAKEGYLSSKAQNALVESIAQEEAYLVDRLDRINSMCVHQLDLMRTIISKEKEELKYLNFQDR
jgi:hypothetical protein